MNVDLGKVFGKSLRYPLEKRIFSLAFFIVFFFSLVLWVIAADPSGIILDSSMSAASLVTYLLMAVPVMIIQALSMIFLLALYAHSASDFFRGKTKPIEGYADAAKKRFFPLLLTSVLLGLIMIACFGGVTLSTFFLFSSSSAQALMLLLAWIVVGMIVGTVILFMLFLSPVISVLDRKGPMEAVRSSWQLVGRNKLDTLIYLVVFIIIYILIGLLGSVPEIILAILSVQQTGLTPAGLMVTVLNSLFAAYLFLFTASSQVNYYSSLKEKKAGK